MNSGITEQAGKTAQATISALSSTPLVLSLVIFNILFMGLIAWSTHESGARWERMMQKALETCASKT